MSDWDVYLEFSEGSSSKFWRAKTEGSSVTVNYGRIGSDGQSKSKAYGSAAEARADMDKQAAGKRKKGYADAAGAAAPAAPVEEEAQPETPGSLALSLDRDGRTIRVKIELEGKTLKTEVVEGYADETTAQAAMRRIAEGMKAEGYR